MKLPHKTCLLVMAMFASTAASPTEPTTLAPAEASFIDYLDAVGAQGVVASGYAPAFEGRDGAAWDKLARERRDLLDARLDAAGRLALGPADARALAAMRRTLAALASEAPGGQEGDEPACAEAAGADIGYARLRAALVACFVQYGNAMSYEGRTIDRGTALQLLHVEGGAERRRAIFAAFEPLWRALTGDGGAGSPYRRLIALASSDAAKNGSEVDTAARALGVTPAALEGWLVAVLEAWSRSTGPAMVEPWDYRYVNSGANRALEAVVRPESLLPVNERYYDDLGADLVGLRVLYDLAQRRDKSPLAYTDFVSRGRDAPAGWVRPVARVVGTYPDGGLYSLNELVHENGHAVHVSAIHTRPAYMDWPDTLFTEAFADVPSWSVYEPAWQRRYLGRAADEASSQRALFGDVMLDVAWSLFELRLLRDPSLNPNVLWTDITSRYLHVVPHPEIPWWAVRVQLVDAPGYMVNYGLGAVLTAEMRRRTAEAIGPFDTGNPRWYGWLSDTLLRYGSERDTRTLMDGLLGRPVSPDALIEQIRRCGRPTP
ncbi:MAG: hypothetical protein U1F09_11245 [Steroidobacteraceae bacterium]